MTSKQTAAVQYITNRITKAAQYVTREGWANGPVVFSVAQVGKDVLVFASNATPEKLWFETYCYACVVVGPRGGIKLQSCEGFSRAQMPGN
jgi:hypothetical protein